MIGQSQCGTSSWPSHLEGHLLFCWFVAAIQAMHKQFKNCSSVSVF